MQTAALPAHICDGIDRKIRNFIWGSTNGARNIHNINWDMVCRPKSLGGLGLRSARDLNRAFIMKLIWGILSLPEELWVKVLTSKYLKRIDYGWVLARKSGFSAVWRVMIDLNLVVADCCNPNGTWNLTFLHEVLLPNSIPLVIGMQPPKSSSGEDRLVWGLEDKGIFSIKTAYLLLKDINTGEEEYDWRLAWSIQFGVTAWIIWKARNNLVFEDIKDSVEATANKCRYWINLILTSWKTNQLGQEAPGLARQALLVVWWPRDEGWSILNTDGSRYHNNRSTAIGGVLRDRDGRFARAFCANIGDCSITKAELRAIIEGMKMAWDLGVDRLHIQNDSSTAVSSLLSTA
ncbi:Putative ribonuclease H protein At1g65750 [Linum perenne]